MPALRTVKKSKDRYHHGDLRRALLDATLAIVAREGTGAVSLSAAARRVGVSPQATYNHFRDKAALLAAAAEEGLRGLERAMLGARDEHRAAGARFEAIGVGYVTFACANGAYFRLFSAPELADKREHPGLLDAYRDAFGVVLAAIEECQREGVVRAGASRKFALSAWSAVHGIAWLMVDGQIAVAEVASEGAGMMARDVLRVLFRGLEAREK